MAIAVKCTSKVETFLKHSSFVSENIDGSLTDAILGEEAWVFTPLRAK